ncbi:hypothetical protein FJ208_00885 [Candidatus Gribaldobacteria bacterium]|nr:hypothetical protein [Candidatus Gribaldobacteria bacterium]
MNNLYIQLKKDENDESLNFVDPKNGQLFLDLVDGRLFRRISKANLFITVDGAFQINGDTLIEMITTMLNQIIKTIADTQTPSCLASYKGLITGSRLWLFEL